MSTWVRPGGQVAYQASVRVAGGGEAGGGVDGVESEAGQLGRRSGAVRRRLVEPIGKPDGRVRGVNSQQECG